MTVSPAPHASPADLCRAVALGKDLDGPEGRLRILDDLDLAVAPGAAVAILGASGSGKSTLLGLLAGLDRPSRGRVWLCGTDLTPLDEDARAALRRGQVGFVFQQFQLLPTLTALENVLLPLELGALATPTPTDWRARLRFWRAAAAHKQQRERAAAALAQVGLSARLGHYPRQLSGGEQQRVAIARAFAPAPRILFADEPTGNLDAVTGARIIDLLLRLRAETGAALVLVTHDPPLATRCDRRLALREGRLEPLP